MRSRLKFLLLYLLVWLGVFEIARLIFLCFQHRQTSLLDFATISKTFLYGFRMDLSMSSYILLPVSLFVLASVVIPVFRRPVIYKIYTGVVLFFILLLVIIDLQIFREWGIRIDNTPLKYLSTPGEAWASVSHLPVFLYLGIFLLVHILSCIFIFRLLNRWSRYLDTKSNKIYTGLVLVVFIAALIIPIRGGFQLIPMNQSSVYFSNHNFANLAAVNAPWNFLYTVTSERESATNPYHYFDKTESGKITDSLYKAANKTDPSWLNTSRPNIILIIWESFAENATKVKSGGVEVTPGFNRLKREGLYFSNLYSSGDRTDKGITAILSGYPALPKGSIVRLPAKTAKLNTLPGVFRKENYRTGFYYGGETEFANIKSFLLHNGFDPLVDKSAFRKADLNSKWGAHDGVVADKIFSDLQTITSPYFTSWLTLSSHEPFEIPGKAAIPGSDHQSMFFNAHHYTDSVIYRFVERCKQLPSWKNTLIIIVADHGHPLLNNEKKIEHFRIPMLWLGGALNRPNTVYKEIASQLDIASTLCSQTIGKRSFPFSKDLADSSVKPWAFFTFNNGFGFTVPGGYIIYDNIGKKIIEHDSQKAKELIRCGQALQQFTFQDYVDK
jgi:phosphoglycerol transferase MdoB-like AlkP superfamily enzyme